MDKLIENEIYIRVKRSNTPKHNNILRLVWSHRQNTTPSGEIYLHRSRLYADVSTQKQGIDFNEIYSPVI